MSEVEEQKALVVEVVQHEGLWHSPPVSEHCCIYRVPHCLRSVNPEAYTPQILIIGPLHHSKKAEAKNMVAEMAKPNHFLDVDSQTKSRYLGYLNMEHQKEAYLCLFKKRVEQENLEKIERAIKEDENMIRQSYSESTEWIKSEEFVTMILRDSIFIVEFILRNHEKRVGGSGIIGDMHVDKPCLVSAVTEDLILLENQLPYFLLEKLFQPLMQTCDTNVTFRELILMFFGLKDKITKDFRHFTDLLRLARVQTHDDSKVGKIDHLGEKTIDRLHSAEKLDLVGVKFKPGEKEDSMNVAFEDGSLVCFKRVRLPYFMPGCLTMPRLTFDEVIELKLRNIMALEQCHYPSQLYVCNYVSFLDDLIDSEKDVDLLVEKGIIKNWAGGSVAEMVNKLCLGTVEDKSLYYDVATRLNAYHDNPWNKFRTILGRVYFNNPWKGAGTVAAVLLLIMTLIQTVTSIIQTLNSKCN